MPSAATSAGEATIMITFEPGTDPNVAVLNVNNRIQMVKNQLPPIVEREGIIVMQNMTSMLMYVNIYSTDPNADQSGFQGRYAKAASRDFDGDPKRLTEMDALVAYLQMLGTLVDFTSYEPRSEENLR